MNLSCPSTTVHFFFCLKRSEGSSGGSELCEAVKAARGGLCCSRLQSATAIGKGWERKGEKDSMAKITCTVVWVAGFLLGAL